MTESAGTVTTLKEFVTFLREGTIAVVLLLFLLLPGVMKSVLAKRALGRDDFQVDPRLLRRGLLDNGYGELVISSENAVAVDLLPPIHKDPFDRVLVAQAAVEGITLLTADPVVAQYPGSVRLV